jgi:hypothetical protein
MTFQMKVLLNKKQGFLEEHKKEGPGGKHEGCCSQDQPRLCCKKIQLLWRTAILMMSLKDVWLEGCMDAFGFNDNTV